MKIIWIAVGFFLPLGGLSTAIAAGAITTASDRITRFAAVETNGILTDMLLFSPGPMSVEACAAIDH